MTRIEIRICGLGGQGVVLAGQILGLAAVNDGKNAVQTQSYGAEARGSAAKSEVIISDGKIGYPMVRKCDILVTMSQSALDTHLEDLKENGILLVDEDMVKIVRETKATIFRFPITTSSENLLKSKIYANVIMLGILVRIGQIVSKEAMVKAIETVFKADNTKANLEAFRIGYDL